MAKAAVSPLAPKKGRRPDFTGVPGEIVSLDGLGDLHWGNKLRGSPYDALLDQLAAAGQGKALKFGDEKARTSVVLRARKKGYKVSCAVQGGRCMCALTAASMTTCAGDAGSRSWAC